MDKAFGLLIKGVPVPIPCHASEHLVLLGLYLSEEEALRGVDMGNMQVLDGDKDKDRVNGRDLLDEVREDRWDALH
jgi:hypothetical protein